MKKVLYVLLGISVLYFILALFGPTEIKIEREIIVDRSTRLVKERLGDFNFFHNFWSPWTEKDSAMVCTYKGNPGEVGHLYTWSGNKDVGKGEMEITTVTADSICSRLSFDGEGDSRIYYIVKEEHGQTKIIWGLLMEIGFFGRTPMLFINMDKIMGADFEKGLGYLKTALMNIKEEANVEFDIKLTDWEETSFIGRKETVSFENMNKYIEDNFGKLALVMESNNLPTGTGFGLVFSYDEENQKTDMCVSFKVTKDTKVKGWEIYTFPAGKVVSAAFKGDPANTGQAHGAISNYLNENGLNYKMVMEEYTVGPGESKDLSKCVTLIHYLLK